MSEEPLGWTRRTRGEARRLSFGDQANSFEPDFKNNGKLLKVFIQRHDRLRHRLLKDHLCGLRDLNAYVHTKTCTCVFTAALLIKAKSGNNPDIHQLVNGKTKFGITRQWKLFCHEKE